MVRGSRVLSVASATALALALLSSSALADVPKCQDGVAKGSRNVANQTQKKNRKCVKDNVGDITTCINTESDKAIIKRTKLVELYDVGGKCDPVPIVGVNPDPNDIANDTEADANAIIKRVFGDPVDGINQGTETDTKCHDKIAKRAGKKYDTELKAFRGCIKDAAPVPDQAAVNTCISTGVNDTKAQVTVQGKLDADVLGACEGGFPIAGTEDGDCNLGSAAAFSACVGNIVDCESCLAMSNSNNGSADCDIVDDGMDNNSCASPGPPPCPLPAGRYTVTQVTGGTLKVDGGAPFVFPTGGSIIEEVSAASQPDCVHNVVVPFPGGLTTPVFCSVAAFTFTTKVTQTGCGRGYIDSNGGSDFTVTELGDTNAPNAPCNFPAAACMTGLNTNVRVDLTLGGNGPDVCGGGGTANAFVGIPVHTVTWQDLDGDCPDLDGNFDAGTDTLVTDFDQNLDFTTDTSTADWTDLDPNGCCINGSGPGATAPCNTGPAGLTSTGVCMNIGAGTVTTSATGTIGSNGAPLFDLTFSNQLPSTITGPVAPTGATCPGFIIPPATGGTITRCIP